LCAQVSLTYADPGSQTGVSTSNITDSGGNPAGPVVNPFRAAGLIGVSDIKNATTFTLGYEVFCWPSGIVLTTFGLTPGQTLHFPPGTVLFCPKGDVIIVAQTLGPGLTMPVPVFF